MASNDFKLYYTPTSCGAGNFIAASLAELKFDHEIVDLASHKTASGADFYKTNPKGNVPTIVTKDGKILNENIATLLWIAAKNPKAKLAPAAGTPEYYETLNQLSYVATELHKTIGSLFNPALNDDAKKLFKEASAKKLAFWENDIVGKKKFAGGDSPNVADIYAYIVISWTGYLGVALTDGQKAFSERVKAFKGVQAAHDLMNAEANKGAKA